MVKVLLKKLINKNPKSDGAEDKGEKNRNKLQPYNLHLNTC